MMTKIMKSMLMVKIFMKLTMTAKDSDHHEHFWLVFILKIKKVMMKITMAMTKITATMTKTTTMTTTMMLMIKRREVVGGRDVALLTAHRSLATKR